MSGHQYQGKYQRGYFQKGGFGALEFLEAHVENYLNSELEKALKVFRAEASFLRGQLDDTSAELTRIESELLKFKEQNLDAIPELAAGTHTTRMSLMGRRTDLSAEHSRLRMELAMAKQRLKAENAIVQDKVESTQPYKTRLAEINRQIGEARASGLANGHPTITRLEAEAEGLKGLINRTVSSGTTDIERRANPTYQRLKAEVDALSVAVQATGQELGGVSGNIDELNTVVSKLPQVEARLEELNRAHDATKGLHGRLFDQLKKAELQVELERASAAARYEMIIPPVNVWPGRVKTWGVRVGGGLFVGLLIGLLIALLRELRNYLRDNMSQIAED
jgi:uncharacterized protein involved in exopolysaccharide biosynthesis